MSLFSRSVHRFIEMAVVSAVVVAMSSAAVAQQQNIQPLLDRIERLERDIRTLNVQIARGGTPAPLASEANSASPAPLEGHAIARMGARMDSLESDLRVATGTMERVNHDVALITERLDKLVSDIDFRLSALEAKAQPGANLASVPGQLPAVSSAPTPAGVQTVAPAPGSQTLGTVSLSEIAKVEQAKEQGNGSEPSAQTAAPPETTTQAAALPAGTAKEQYTYAFNLLRQTNYEQAEIALKSFITRNTDDPLASNARYWLGETYYVRRAYNDAAQVFFEGFSKDPEGPKAADSLLKLGMSLAGLGKADDACAAFSKVLADFPNATTTIKNAVAKERKRSSCP